MKNFTPFSQSSGVVIKHIVLCMMLMLMSVAGFSLTYTWTGANSTDWTDPANWSAPRTTPATTDILIFNNGAVNTVTNVPTETIGQLLVNGNTTVNLEASAANNVLTLNGVAGNGLIVAAGSALNIDGINNMTLFISNGVTSSINGNMTLSNAAHRFDGGGGFAPPFGNIVFNSPAIFTQGVGCTGTVFNNSGSLNIGVFNSGSTFVQKDGGNPFGATTPPNTKISFQTGSLFKLQQNVAPTVLGRVYANFEIDFATFNQAVTGTGPITMDDLTITQGIFSLNSITGGINLKGNISVALGQSLSFNSNTLSLIGTTNQSITNNGTLTFGAAEPVIINNAAGITINNDITWQNTVTFTSGIVKVTSPFVLTLTSIYSGVSNNSYVDGKIKKVGIGAGGYIFPVGKTISGVKSYVPISISNLTFINAGDSYTAEYIRGDAQALGTINTPISNAVTLCRRDYWTLDRTVSNPLSAADVTLNWTTESSANGAPTFITDPTTVVVMHLVPGPPGLWDNFGNTSTGTGTNIAGSVVWPGWTNSSASTTLNTFAFGSINFNNPLPITINYINGVKQGSTNLINWQVACVNNLNATMIVERSADNRNFTAINTITASALRCAQPFNYYDNSPLSGINYYRLKTINDNGAVTYSSVIALMNKDAGFDIVNLLPNIVTSTAVLNVTSAKQSQLNIVITDMMGRKVQQSAFELVAGSNQFNLNLAHLASGTYQISGYTAEGINKTIRFVKQ